MRFSELRLGLDHVAFGCQDRAELENSTSSASQHTDIEDSHYGSDVSFRDPDGIALEFFAR